MSHPGPTGGHIQTNPRYCFMVSPPAEFVVLKKKERESVKTSDSQTLVPRLHHQQPLLRGRPNIHRWKRNRGVPEGYFGG